MRRLRYALLFALLAFAMPGSFAEAALSTYQFSVSTGSALSPSFTGVWTGSQRGRGSNAGRSTAISLPFSFIFDGNTYSTIRLSSHGLISFGSSVSTSYSNSMPSAASSGPAITAFWDNVYISGSAPNQGCNFTSRIRYGTVGVSPNRIFVIDYDDISKGYCDGCQYGPMYLNWQVRLYEGSSKIEFYYGEMSPNVPSCLRNWGTRSMSTSASIGIAASTSDYISVSPNGANATISTTSFNNSVNLSGSNPITTNTVYTFSPCNAQYNANTSSGGVANMPSGATLLNASVQRGNSQTFQPFTLSLPFSGCPTKNLSITLTGANTGDFTVTPLGSQSLASNQTIQFTITFTPQSIGARSATLTVSDPTGETRSFTLSGTGLPRVSWTTNTSSGGTPALNSGDTLMDDIIVPRRTCRDFNPFTLMNFSTNDAIPPAQITYTIDSAGMISTQYQLVTPAVENLGPGQTSTPTIRFCGTGLGNQTARLTVNADGEIRTFYMNAISGAPGIAITSPGGAVNADNPLYHQTFACVGDVVTTVPLVISNPGQYPLIITSMEFYRTDTAYTQGVPSYPLVRDSRGRVIPMTDYIITDVPGVAPINRNAPAVLPITINPGETRTVYATFVGQLPGKRFGRAFIRTNGENAFGTDTAFDATPNGTLGLLNVDLIGRSLGSQLAATKAGLKLQPVVFKPTRLGDTAYATFTIANSGACDLRINRNKLRIYSGDVHEIKMMTSLTNAFLDQSTGDYVLAPGQVDSIRVRFVPSRGGTRQATMWIQTNDSTISHPGLAERGAYYLDLHGLGLAGLDAHDLVLNPVVIGSSVTGIAVLENSQTVPFGVASIGFIGGDAAEFTEDNANPWKARPFNVLPGSKLELGVRLTPVGQAGPRRTTLIVVSTNNDTIRVPIRGEAGTQTLVVSPTSLFEDVTIAVGQNKRQTVMIANDGTLPVRILGIRIIGPDSTSYLVGRMPRLNLEAGQTEYLEITYAPNAPGQTSAQLEVTASNGQVYLVDLGGTALRIRRDPVDPPMAPAPGVGVIQRQPGSSNGPTLK